jgi:hypothetical protein
MKTNYREANCCNNCKFYIYDSWDYESYCTKNSDSPKKEDIKNYKFYWENRIIVNYYICDEFEIK